MSSLLVMGRAPSEVTTSLRGRGRELPHNWCKNYCRPHHDTDVPTPHKPSGMGTLAMLHDSPVKLFSKIKKENKHVKLSCAIRRES